MSKKPENKCPICDEKVDYQEWYDERGIVEHLSTCERCEWKYHYAYGDYFVTIKKNRWEMKEQNRMMKALMEKEISLVCDMYKTVFFIKERPNEELYNQFLIITKVRVPKEKEKHGHSTFDADGF